MPAADDASILVGTIIALIADPDQHSRPHMGVADHTLPLTLLAESPYRDTDLFAAHDEIWVMLGHRALF